MNIKKSILIGSGIVTLALFFLIISATRFCVPSICTDWGLSFGFGVFIISLVLFIALSLVYKLGRSLFYTMMYSGTIYIIFSIFFASTAKLSSGYGLSFGDSPSLRIVVISIIFLAILLTIIVVTLIINFLDRKSVV